MLWDIAEDSYFVRLHQIVQYERNSNIYIGVQFQFEKEFDLELLGKH